ncbi:BolA family protein [Galenea microaerophila]
MSIQQQIEQAIRDHFSIEELVIENESHRHAGPAAETHFKVVLVSPDFEGITKIKRQQAVYRALGDLMQQVFALGLHTYTPEEWAAMEKVVPASPKCAGGSKR